MILVRYILKEHVAPFLAALSVITFLFVIDFLINILDSVLSKGLPWGVVLEVFALNLAWMLSLSVPMAVLVASLMAFGRLSGDHEITAVKAAGIAPVMLMRPVLLVAFFLSCFLVCFNNWILPEANHRSVELMSAISRKKPHAFIDAGRLISQFPGVQLWVNHIDPVSGMMYGIQVFELQPHGAPKIIYADSASVKYSDNGATLMFHLFNGENHIVDSKNPDNYFRIRFSSQQLALKNVDDRLQRKDRRHRSDREMPVGMMLDVVKGAKKDFDRQWSEDTTRLFQPLQKLSSLIASDSIVPEGMTMNFTKDSIGAYRALSRVRIQELSKKHAVDRAIVRLEGAVKRQSQYWVEIHKKFSTAFACFIFVLIGAPLGIMARKGGIGIGVMYSIAFFVIYWVSLIGGENLADRLFVPPAFAMWFSNVFMGIIGLFLTHKVIRDSYSGNSTFKKFLRFLRRLFSAIVRKIGGV